MHWVSHFTFLEKRIPKPNLPWNCPEMWWNTHYTNWEAKSWDKFSRKRGTSIPSPKLQNIPTNGISPIWWCKTQYTDATSSPVNYNFCKFHLLRFQLATNAQLLPVGQILIANSLNLLGTVSLPGTLIFLDALSIWTNIPSSKTRYPLTKEIWVAELMYI